MEDVGSTGDKVVLVETGAIVEYLVQKSGGQLGPSHATDALRYRQFLHYAEGSVMPVLFALLVVSKVPLLGRVAAKTVRPMLDVHLENIEATLTNREGFAGKKFRAADIMMGFPLEAARLRAESGTPRPATIAWLDRIHTRQAYRRALEKGGAYRFAE